MQRALDLSLKGSGFVNPNPMVGCVIVNNNKIVGEGYHASFGGPHAEVNAIENAGVKCKDATLYVTLEPCNHQGKTPPCTNRIIQEKFRKVVVGMKDQNPRVTGDGISRLVDAGIEVVYGVLEDEIRKSNEIFLQYIHNKIPFCTLKTAMTLDGKIATHTGDSKWISGEKSRNIVHQLRHRYSAILVGLNTVITDDPELTDRSDFPAKSHPVRIVVDSKGRTPLTSRILDTRVAQTIIATTHQAPDNNLKALEEKGAEVIVCPEHNGRVSLSSLVNKLGVRGIDSILVEGGGQLNYSTLEEAIIDKIYAFVSPKIIGGLQAISPIGGEGISKISDAVHLNIDQVSRVDEDILIEAYVK